MCTARDNKASFSDLELRTLDRLNYAPVSLLFGESVVVYESKEITIVWEVKTANVTVYEAKTKNAMVSDVKQAPWY